MRTTTAEILELIRLIAKHPAMFAETPESAGGQIEALAAVALAENSSRSLQIANCDVGRILVPEAVTDVPRSRSLGVALCDECAVPRRTSFEAVTRHTEALLKVLASYGVGAEESGGGQVR